MSKFDQAKLMELYEEGKSDSEISRITGISEKGVKGWRGRNFLRLNGKQPAINEDVAFRLWEDGLNDEVMAQRMKCGKATVARWREINSLEANGPIFNWQIKLKPSEFMKIPVKYRKEGLYV